MHRSSSEVPRQIHEKSDVLLRTCLLDSDISSRAGARRTRREAFGISLAIEILILGLLLVAPLFSSIAHPNLRPILPSQLTFFRSAPQPKYAQPLAASTTTQIPKIYDPFPPVVPIHAVATVSNDEEPGGREPSFGGPYIPGADPTSAGVIPQFMREPTAVPKPLPIENHPVKISEGVLEAQLITRIEPRYPALAVQTKTEGIVRLHAIISRAGHITSLDILSGHPLLIPSALEAVSQWRYRPTMLNGEPVEVETSITVIFRLHN